MTALDIKMRARSHHPDHPLRLCILGGWGDQGIWNIYGNLLERNGPLIREGKPVIALSFGKTADECLVALKDFIQTGKIEISIEGEKILFERDDAPSPSPST